MTVHFYVLYHQVLKGHDDHVITCLQFCGNRIVSGSDDNTLKVWSAVTGKVSWLFCWIPSEISYRWSIGMAKYCCAISPHCGVVFSAVWCRNWKKCWWTSGSSFSTQKTSLVAKSHLDVKLQCYSCYLWHISLFSWWFSFLVESFVTWFLKNLDRYVTLFPWKLPCLACFYPSDSPFLTCLLAFFLLFSSYWNGMLILLALISNTEFVFLSKLYYNPEPSKKTPTWNKQQKNSFALGLNISY